MFVLPKTTEFNKRIPKQKFYENMEISSAMKQIFVKQIKTIYWKNKIASSTTHLAVGQDVTEVEVLEIQLNSQEVDESVLRQIDKKIPYHILFLLEYQEKYQVWIGYKESTTSGNQALKVNGYYHTGWQEKIELPLYLEGLSIDAVYENFVRQVAGDKLQVKNVGENLKEAVSRDMKRKSLQKQIDVLKGKIRKEKQLNKQMQMNAELKKIKELMRRLI